MRLALALVAAMVLGMVPAAGAGADPAAPLHAEAAKKKCKKGYVRRTVERKRRVRGELRTVKVKKCVKKKRSDEADQPQADPQPEPQPDPGPTSCASPYLGQATAMDGVFQYGAVRVERTCGEVTFVEIESVSTNCNTSSFTFIMVFAPSDPATAILEGSNQIFGDTMHVVYQPERTSANQTTMDITFTGNTARGEFHSIGNCKQDGLFTATAG